MSCRLCTSSLCEDTACSSPERRESWATCSKVVGPELEKMAGFRRLQCCPREGSDCRGSCTLRRSSTRHSSGLGRLQRLGNVSYREASSNSNNGCDRYRFLPTAGCGHCRKNTAECSCYSARSQQLQVKIGSDRC